MGLPSRHRSIRLGMAKLLRGAAARARHLIMATRTPPRQRPARRRPGPSGPTVLKQHRSPGRRGGDSTGHGRHLRWRPATEASDPKAWNALTSVASVRIATNTGHASSPSKRRSQVSRTPSMNRTLSADLVFRRDSLDESGHGLPERVDRLPQTDAAPVVDQQRDLHRLGPDLDAVASGRSRRPPPPRARRAGGTSRTARAGPRAS